MMRALLLICAALVWLAEAAPSFAAFPHGTWTPPIATCPQGTGFDDGCADANPNGSFQISRGTFYGSYDATAGGWVNSAGTVSAGVHGSYDHAQQNGQVFYAVPPWNEAGIDYPIGYDTTKTLTPVMCGLTITNPQTGATTTPACPTGVTYPGGKTKFCTSGTAVLGAAWNTSYTATCDSDSYLYSLGCARNAHTNGTILGSTKVTAYPYLYCTKNISNPELAYLSFSPDDNGGTCIQTRFARGTPGDTLKIDNNKFKAGLGCSDISGSANLTNWLLTDQYSVEITDNDVDGDSLNPAFWGDGCVADAYAVQCSALTAFPVIVTGVGGTMVSPISITVQRNAFYNLTGDPMTGAGDFTNFDIADNVMLNVTDFCRLSGGSCNGQHGAFIGLNPQNHNAEVLSQTYTNNTCLYPASYAGIGTTCFSSLGRGGFNNTYGDVSGSLNVAISNMATKPPSAQTFPSDTSSLSGTAMTEAALAEVLHVASVTDYSWTQNYVYPVGALSCVQNLGDDTAIGGMITQPVAGQLKTLDVTTFNSGGAIYGAPYSVDTPTYKNIWLANGSTLYGAIYPWGTTLADGSTASGHGGAGTYGLSQNQTTPNGTFSGAATKTTAIGALTIGSNVNMAAHGTDPTDVTVSTSTLSVAGVQWSSGSGYACAHANGT